MQNDSQLFHIKPAVPPPLDPDFRPISLGNRRYLEKVRGSKDKTPLTVALERHDGRRSVFKTEIFAPGSCHDPNTHVYVERWIKFLLWQKGGWKLIFGGPPEIGERIRQIYSHQGTRVFDVKMMERVYEKSFVIEIADASEIPQENESSEALGGYFEGCRIGFDLGASDYKIAAVINGETVFTRELPWDPQAESNPNFHYQKINEGLRLAAQHLPRVDAIGGSSAGIYIGNKIMHASLFRAVPQDLFDLKIKPMFLYLEREWGVPLKVANDGDVTALAGAISFQTRSILGISMGSSEAGGYLNGEGHITGWLNELAFAPLDYNPNAVMDEWSSDRGCGAQYFSQQAVVRLAPAAGIVLPERSPAEQLKFVQDLHQSGDPRHAKIFETIGVYLGYALAQYAEMYDYHHALILGRVTSGKGGDLILQKAKEVLKTEFPELDHRLAIHLPDEKNRRMGQAVAAASLPSLKNRRVLDLNSSSSIPTTSPSASRGFYR